MVNPIVYLVYNADEGTMLVARESEDRAIYDAERFATEDGDTIRVYKAQLLGEAKCHARATFKRSE